MVQGLAVQGFMAYGLGGVGLRGLVFFFFFGGFGF